MLSIGAHNIHYLYSKRDRIYDANWEYRLEGKKKLWVNAHDIVILCDTKLTKQTFEQSNNPFPGFNMTNEFAHENKWGVSILTRVHLAVTRCDINLHEILTGRIVAVEILMPSEGQAPPIKLGIVGVYAPDSSYHAGQIVVFFTELEKVLQKVKDSCDFTYMGGDFNAVMNNARDSFNYRRPPRTYQRDRLLQQLVARLGFYDPLDEIEPDHNAKEHYTFATPNDLNDALDVTYRRIDHILCSAPAGINNYFIDPGQILNPMNIERCNYDSVSDHTPVSLIINPGELNAAIMPERFELRTFKRTKYPEPDQLIESEECRDHFTHVDKLLEEDCAFIFKNRDIFSTATNQEKDRYTEALNKILGKILPEPYKKTIFPGKNKWISKEQWNIMKMITKVKKVRAAVHYIMRSRTGLTNSAQKLIKSQRKYRDPIQGVRDPHPFIIAGTNYEDRMNVSEYVEWYDELELKRKTLWEEYNQEGKAAKRVRSERFRELYKTEAKKMSRFLRILAYPKDKTEGSIVVLAEGELLVTTKAGILHEYKKTWEGLGKKPVRDPESPLV
eukprot:814269-Pyramimonas_sp.AAC.1